MLDILFSPFMLRALVAAAATGLAAPAVGAYLVQRRLSLMGDGIGHICVTGVALGVLTGTSPVLAHRAGMYTDFTAAAAGVSNEGISKGTAASTASPAAKSPRRRQPVGSRMVPPSDNSQYLAT